MAKKINKDNTSSYEHIITPGQLVYKRFMKNKLAIVGLIILVVMFLFAFIGPFFSPYGEYEMFYKTEFISNIYVITGSNELYALNEGDGRVLWRMTPDLKITKQPQISVDGILYIPLEDGSVLQVDPEKGQVLATLTSENDIKETTYYTTESKPSETIKITLEDGYLIGTSVETGVKKWDFIGYANVAMEPIIDANGNIYTVCEDGEVFGLKADRGSQRWSLPTEQLGPYMLFEGPVKVNTIMNKSHPTKEHILGTDKFGLDVMTRLMYGGRISLLVGFVVIIIEMFIGVLLGGISGYYGKWIDNLIMRVVDIFNCIPTLPIMLILSSFMIAMKVPPQQKIYVLMLLLGILGWPYIARVVRGQILSLREQDFIIAVEATGIRPMRRIFKHLVPNVMPQLIVIATLSIGGVILTESALSYLGIGLDFPYASWGNMVDAVNDPEIMRNFLNIWVPPGVCILLTVMAFNFVGDGLRDAFDPKMKR